MLYAFYGSNIGVAREKAHTLVTGLRAKSLDAEYFRVTAEEYSHAYLEELTHSQGLFKQSYIVLFDNILRDVSDNILMDYVPALAEQGHVFILLEEKITAPIKKKLETYARESKEYTLGKKESSEAISVFALSDALLARDKKALWTLLARARMVGKSGEEIHGTLFWSMKSLALAQSADSPEDAGLKPYPFRKAKEAAKKYSKREVTSYITKLSGLLTHSRRKGVASMDALELFALSL